MSRMARQPRGRGLELSLGAKRCGCCWPRYSRSPRLIARPSLKVVTSTQLGTEFCDAGAGRPFALQRSFQLMPQFQSPAGNARFHSSDTYLQRPGDLFITESFDVAQNNSLAIRSAQTFKRLAQLRFSLTRQGLLFGTWRILTRQRCRERLVSMLVN